jgi:hypothetical protein
MPYGGEWRGRVDKVREGKEKTEKGKKELLTFHTFHIPEKLFYQTKPHELLQILK